MYTLSETFELNFDVRDLKNVLKIEYHGEDDFEKLSDRQGQFNTIKSNAFFYIDDFYKYPERVKEFWLNQRMTCDYQNKYDYGYPLWKELKNSKNNQLPFSLPSAPACRLESQDQQFYKVGDRAVTWEKHYLQANIQTTELFNELLKYVMPREILKQRCQEAGVGDIVDYEKCTREITEHNRYANIYSEDMLDDIKLNFMMKQPHSDSKKFGWLIPLTEEKDSVGGTAFFRHKKTGHKNQTSCMQKARDNWGLKLEGVYPFVKKREYDVTHDTIRNYCESIQWRDGTKLEVYNIYPEYENGKTWYCPYWYPDEWKTRAGDVKDNGVWEVYHFNPHKYNRFNFYCGTNYHSAVIPQKHFKNGTERMIELGFMNTRWNIHKTRPGHLSVVKKIN